MASRVKSYYEKIRREIKSYINLRRGLELYTTGKIKELIERYYNMFVRPK